MKLQHSLTSEKDYLFYAAVMLMKPRTDSNTDHVLNELEDEFKAHRTFYTINGKVIILNTEEDIILYDDPYINGKKLYAHKDHSGKVYFYFYYTFMWEPPRYELITPDKAREFLLEKSNGISVWNRLIDLEMKRTEEYFPGIFKKEL